MVDKLGIYNGALRLLGQQRLASLSEEVHTRREIDSVYDRCIQAVLERALWKFSLRSSELTYETDVDPAFGHPYAFEIPSDFVRISAISTSPYFRGVEPDYLEEAGYWYSSSANFYLRYVSNGEDYGLNIGKWPEYFARVLEADIADATSGTIGNTDIYDRMTVNQLRKEQMSIARQMSAIDEPVKSMPEGRLSHARRGGAGEPTIERGRLRWR